MAPGRKKDKAEPKAKRGRRSFPDEDDEDELMMDSDDSMASPSKKGKPKSKAKTKAKPKGKSASKKSAAAESDNDEDENDPDDVDERRALLHDGINEEDLLNMIIPPPPEKMVEGDRNKRLMISSIEVENFKSYYGKQVIGPFHKNFTAIIGPNGSGKSNVIDSLLFVFGYRAAKIRSKKVSVLIHNSANHDDIDRCRVQVNFQQIIDEPDGKYTVVPGSEFNVARTGYKNNSSQYQYNGRMMQFKEVAKILREVGIDLIHNRFLILQGEVEQISLMKPKAPSPNEDGMLEYLEDIIGCSRLKAPIEKLNEKCAKLQDMRTTQFSRVKHAEREKEALEAPVREIMQHLRLENAISLVDSKRLYKKLYKKQDALEEHAPQIEVAKTEIREKKDKLKELLVLQDEQTKELKTLQKKLEQAQDGLMNTKTSHSTVEGELQTKRKEIKRNAEKIAKIKADIKKEEKKMVDYESQPDKCEKKIAEQKQIGQEAQEDEEKWQKLLDEKLAEIEEKSAELNEKKKEREQELDGAVGKRDAVESKLRIAKTEHSNLCDEGSREENKMKEITQAMTETEKNLENKASELNKLKEAIPNKEQAIVEAENRRRELKTRREELDGSIRPLRSRYEEERSASASFQTQNKICQALMREKEKGTIEGFYGRLGDLGAIPEKYDIAISTTCGKLNNFVVSTVNAAESCINFLKRNNIGQATFIALEKQEHLISRMRQKISTPDNAPRLFDLITVKDQNVLPAFYYALQDTLYADDIEKATAISVHNGKRWRVVTAKGELVDTGGTMTGGGSRIVKGLIGSSVKVDTNRRNSGVDLEEMQRNLQAMEREISDVEREMSALSRQMECCRREKIDLEGRYVNVENAIGNLTSRLSGLQESHAAQEKAMHNATRNEGAIEEAKEKVDRLQKEKDKAEEIVKKHKSHVREISDQLQEIFDEIKGDCQKNLDDAKKRKVDAAKSVTTQQTTLNNLSRNIAKTQKRINELNSDLERTESAIEDDETRIAEFEEKLESLTAKIIDDEKAKVEAEEALKEANSKNAESNDEEIALKNELNAVEKNLKELQDIVAKIKHDIDRYLAELSKLTFQYVTFVNRLPAAITAPENSDEILTEAYNIEMEAVRNNNRRKKQRTAAISDDEAEPMETDEDADDSQEITDGEEEEEISVHTMISNIEIPAPNKQSIKDLTDQQLEYYKVQLDEMAIKKKYDFNNLVDFYHKLVKYEKECKELDDISAKRDAHRNFLADLKAMRHNEFMDGFQKIGSALKEMYQMITLGGDASLDLVDSLDPFNEGVSFGVRPPKKSWKQITNLSGGEKTLSSLALVFALHQYKPTPLYVMDEIDAALDFRNVSIIGHYIKEKTKNAQFIIISLRNNMFELGDRLVGIYKTFDCTKNVCVDPDEVTKETAKKIEVLNQEKAVEAARIKMRLQDGGPGLDPETPIVIS